MSSGPFVRTKNPKLVKIQQTLIIQNQTPIKNQIPIKNQQSKGTYVYKPPVKALKNMYSTLNSSTQINSKKQIQINVVNKDINKELSPVKQNLLFTLRNQGNIIDQQIELNAKKNQTKNDQKPNIKNINTETIPKEVTPSKIIRKSDNQNGIKKQQNKPVLGTFGGSRIQRTFIKKNQSIQADTKEYTQKVNSITNITSPHKQDKIFSSSNSSIYKRNLNTPDNTSKMKQTIQIEGQNAPIKRPKLILFNLRRLFKNKLEQHFISIKNYVYYLKFTRSNKINSVHLNSLNRIATKYQKEYLLQLALDKLKLIYSNQLKIKSVKILNPKLNSSLSSLIYKRNSTFCKVLQNIIFNQRLNYKNSMQKIKVYVILKKNTSYYLINALSRLERKNIKIAFNTIKQQNNIIFIRKKIKLMKLRQALTNYKKRQIHKVLFKMIQYTRVNKLDDNKTHNNNQAGNSNAKVQQLSPQVENLIIQIQQLQTKINKIKNQTKSTNNIVELRAKLQTLKQQKQNLQKQNNEKSNKLNQLRQSLQIFKKTYELKRKDNEDSKSPEIKKQNKLPILHQIYMYISRMSEKQCESPQFYQQLFTQYQVQSISQTHKPIRQYLALMKNLQLKKKIRQYQGTQIEKSSRVNNLEEENKIIQKFINSYVKQAYLWQEVKQYVAAVIQ